MTERYRYKPQGVYYDKQLNSVVPEKGSNTIFFGSKGEYSLFKELSEIPNVKLYCHPKIDFGERTWKIDFKIEAQNDTGILFLSKVCNSINNTSFNQLGTLYFEYKGIQDRNFIDKMKFLANCLPTLSNSLILVGKETSAFGCDNLTTDYQTIVKPIISLQRLKTIFNRLT